MMSYKKLESAPHEFLSAGRVPVVREPLLRTFCILYLLPCCCEGRWKPQLHCRNSSALLVQQADHLRNRGATGVNVTSEDCLRSLRPPSLTTAAPGPRKPQEAEGSWQPYKLANRGQAHSMLGSEILRRGAAPGRREQVKQTQLFGSASNCSQQFLAG